MAGWQEKYRCSAYVAAIDWDAKAVAKNNISNHSARMCIAGTGVGMIVFDYGAISLQRRP